MIRKRLAGVILAVLMSLGVVAVAASPAQAWWPDMDEKNNAVETSAPAAGVTRSCFNNSIVYACFQPSGEYLYLKDQEKDGKLVRLHWIDYTGERSGLCTNSLGVDAGWTYCNKNFAEGHVIEWWVSYYSDGWKYGTTFHTKA